MSNFSIEVRGCESLKELNSVVELCDAAFPITPKEYFARHLLKDKTLSFNDTRILLKDGKIVSSVQVFPRIMNIKEGVLRFGGIGNVATLPTERNNGYAGILMNDALEYMIKKGFPLSMLDTHINSYYEKFGFKTILRTISRIDGIEGENFGEIRKFNESEDLQKVMKLYNEFNCKKAGTIVRDQNYWMSQLDFSGEDKDLFLIYESDNELQGFIRADKKDNYVRILEYAFKSGNKIVLKKLLKNLSGLTGIKEFELFLTKNEEENIDPEFSFSLKDEKDFMICFLNESINQEIKKELMSDRNLNFWQSDFF
jgi:predicted N-acetyltransferase YhbS